MASARALPASGSDRRPGLDALRVAATFLVVMLHAAVPFTVAPLPGLPWPVRHVVISPTVDLMFWGIEGAIMPLFFILSGYGAAQSLANRPQDFLSTRWRRLGWPLLAAAAVILPVELYIWLIGWASDGQIPWLKLRSLKLGDFHNNLWGLSHLWYLQYLLIYSVMLWSTRRIWGGGRRKITSCLTGVAPTSRTALPVIAEQPGIHRSGSSPGLPLETPFLAVLAGLTLWIAPEVVVGFQHGFLPFPLKFLYSGLFFAIGVREFHHPRPLALTIPTTILFVGCLLLGLMPLIHRQAAVPLNGIDRLILATGLACYAALISSSSLRFALSAQFAASPSTAYLAKASFWIYLVHHPLVAVWQISLRPTGWPALLQFTVVTIGTLVLSLASYEWLVRRTWVGTFLDGRSSSATTVEEVAPAPIDIPVRRAA